MQEKLPLKETIVNGVDESEKMRCQKRHLRLHFPSNVWMELIMALNMIHSKWKNHFKMHCYLVHKWPERTSWGHNERESSVPRERLRMCHCDIVKFLCYFWADRGSMSLPSLKFFGTASIVKEMLSSVKNARELDAHKTDIDIGRGASHIPNNIMANVVHHSRRN